MREKYCRVLHTYLQETEIYHDFLVIHSISELYALYYWDIHSSDSAKMGHKNYWIIMLLLDGTVSEAKVLDFLDISYDLVGIRKNGLLRDILIVISLRAEQGGI